MPETMPVSIRTKNANAISQEIDVSIRRAKALDLRTKGWSLQEIADELGYTPPNGATHVGNDIRRALEQARAARQDSADSYREQELARLDALVRKVNEILERNHYIYREGEWLALDGKKVVDDSIALQAIDRLEKLSASRRKLLGLDAPTMVQTTGVHVVFEGVDMSALS
jgi:transcriptional regulator